MTRFQTSARTAVAAAQDEARRAGAHRVGVEHLLVALLDQPDRETRRLLGVDAEAAREALADLDRAALLAVGVVVPTGTLGPPRPTTGHLGLTVGFRDVLVEAYRSAKATGSRAITSRHLVRALLGAPRPNPALAALVRLGVDLPAVRAALDEAA